MKGRSALILGGGVFLGWHLAAELLRRGASVTTFRRGVTGEAPPGPIETILGDRRKDLARLDGRTFDVVFDCCGYEPADVELSSAALKRRVGRYVYISSVLAYANLRDIGPRETDPTYAEADAPPRASDPTKYGVKKAYCERIVMECMPDCATIVRPGYLVGPRDRSPRMARWVARATLGGPVVVPELDACPWQLLDVRDAAAFLVDTCAGIGAQIWNLAGPNTRTAGRSLLERVNACLGGQAGLVEVPRGVLLARGAKTVLDQADWATLPAEEAGAYTLNIEAALAAGLRHRSVEETATSLADELLTRANGPGSARDAQERQHHERELLAAIGRPRECQSTTEAERSTP